MAEKSLWEKFKEFDKMMSEPAIIIERRGTIEIPEKESNRLSQLEEENTKLKKIIRKLLESGIKEIDEDKIKNLIEWEE